MIKDEFHLCQSPARERLGPVSSQFIIQPVQLSWSPDWIGEEGGGAGGCLPAWSGVWAPVVVLWAGPGKDEQVGPARGGWRGNPVGKCVCVCLCVHTHAHAQAHALTPMHGCQELCSLSDSAVSSAWLFPCTELNSTRSREKQINLECLVARGKKKEVEKGEDGESAFGVVATGGREEGEISFHLLCF